MDTVIQVQILDVRTRRHIMLIAAHLRGAYDKFPDFFRKGPFDSTRMKL